MRTKLASPTHDLDKAKPQNFNFKQITSRAVVSTLVQRAGLLGQNCNYQTFFLAPPIYQVLEARVGNKLICGHLTDT